MSTFSLDTGAVQLDSLNATCNGSGNVNVPLARYAGDGVTDNAASPAVEITFADVCGVYCFASPGVNAPNVAGAPSVNDNVAGTVPPTVPSAPVVTVPKANVCAPVTPLNSTAPSRCTAVTPGAGAPSCQTTVPSIA